MSDDEVELVSQVEAEAHELGGEWRHEEAQEGGQMERKEERENKMGGAKSSDYY